MPTEQYHEPPEELSQQTRTLARMLTSLIEEAEAINWYEQRISIEKDAAAKAIMQNAQKEEFKHFGMDLEFILRKKPEFRETLKGILFIKGDIVEHGEEADAGHRCFAQVHTLAERVALGDDPGQPQGQGVDDRDLQAQPEILDQHEGTYVWWGYGL